MKKLGLMIVMMLVVFGVLAQAAQPYALYEFPTDVVKYDKKVQRVHKRLTREGYVLQEESANPIFYFMAPYRTHTWGSYARTYTRTYPGHNPQVDYANVYIKIECVMDGGEVLEDGTIIPGTFLGFRQIEITTNETTVY